MKKKLFFLLSAAILFAAEIVNAQKSNEKIDTRIDNIGYWMRMAEKGLVPYNPKIPVKPAEYNGSNKKQIKGVKSVVSADVPVTTLTNTTQSENSVFVDPNDVDFILNSNNSTDWDGITSNNFYGADYFNSGDAGITWAGSVYGAGGTNAGDPAVAINNSGRQFVALIGSNNGQKIAYSDDGINWNTTTVYQSTDLQDKEHLWVDNSVSSPYEGNLYDAWIDFSSGSSNRHILFSRSTNDGSTWSVPLDISQNIAGNMSMGANIQTGPHGEVYVVWAIYDTWPSDEVAIGFAKSTDGGVTFSSPVRIIDNIKGIRYSGVTKNHRVNSFPVMAVDVRGGTNNGNIYVVWTNIGTPGVNTGTNRSIYLIKSGDGGMSWSTPVRVNQGPFVNGKEAYFPWITCDPITGNLATVFYDDRNTNSSSCETFSAYSLDGGNTWTDFVVSDVSFTPAPIAGLAADYMGDYLGITSRGNKFYPCWTDNRNGVFMTYVSPYELQGLYAAFSADATEVCPGSAVTFSDISLGSPTMWNWSFPGGNPSSYIGQNPPPITYDTPGNYDVTLTVSDGADSDTEVRTGYVTVNEVIADFTGTPTTIVVDNTVTFTFTNNSSCNPVSWLWSFTGGTPSSYNGENPPPIQYDTEGTYDVTLIVNNGTYSDTTTKTGYIEVISCPPVTLPWTESFENAGPDSVFVNGISYLNGLCTWSYEKTVNGRLQFKAYSHTGSQAAALDASPSGYMSVNYLINTIDISKYVFSDDLTLSFWYMNNKEEDQPNDKVWIRGSDNDDWIEIYSTLYYGSNMVWTNVAGLDIDDLLSQHGQSISSKFQIRFGQEGITGFSLGTYADGRVFDDIEIDGTMPLTATWTGDVSSDWNVAGNWEGNMVPDANYDVIIPYPVTGGNMPVYSGSLTIGATCRNMLIQGNSSLSVTGDLKILPGFKLLFDKAGSPVISIEGDFINDGIFDGENGNVEFAGSSNSLVGTNGAQDSLTTIFGATVQKTSNYFDITTSGGVPVKINSFDINANSTATLNVEIWYRTDSYVGHTTDPAGWVQLGATQSVTGAGLNNPTPVDPGESVTIPAGSTYGFFISCYISGTYTYGKIACRTGTNTYSNSHITIPSGDESSSTQPGNGGTYTDKIWNGTVHYSLGGTTTLPAIIISKSNASVIPSSDLDITGDFVINPGAYFTVPQDKIMNIAGNTLLKADVNGTASFIEDGTVSFANPPVIQSYISQDRWHIISTPVQNALSEVFLGIYLKYFNEPDYSWNYVTSTSFDLTEGSGFMVWSSSASTGNAIVEYQGQPNNSDIIVTGLSYTATQPLAQRGWNMVGNPYPSSVQWNNVWSRTNVDATIYVYDAGTSGNYLTYNTGGTGTLPNGYIAPGQGFWIKADNSNASLTIPKSERLHSSQSFYKESIQPGQLLCTVTGNGREDKMIIQLNDEATGGFDGEFDAWKLRGDVLSPQLYSVSQGNELTVNSLPFAKDLVIPVCLEVGTDDMYHLLFDELSFNDGIFVYLEDLQTGSVEKIGQGYMYDFYGATTDDKHRFNILITETELSQKEKQIGNQNIYSFNKTVYITGTGVKDITVTIFDMLGKKVFSEGFSNRNAIQIPLDVNGGFYLVKVRCGSDVITGKVFIK